MITDTSKFYCVFISACSAAFPIVAIAQDQIIIGPAAVVAPAYEGSGKYRVLPMPLLNITHGRLFLNSIDGLGIDVIQAGPITVGGSVTYVQGYRTKDAPTGIGRLSDAAGGRLFAAYRRKGFGLVFGATKSFGGGTYGVTADAAMSYSFGIAPRITLTPSISTSWADRKSNSRYFGINPAQSAASGLEGFAPGSGFRDVSTGITARYAMTQHWAVAANATARGVIGDDADSPIVEHKWQPLGTFVVSYAF
jgi:outer membrane protein